MEAYYNNQASNSMLHFSGNYRQRGSGFGALAAGIGRVSLPLARRPIWPAAKTIGRELLVQGAPELLEFATKKKSAKQAPLKSTVAKTARKQIGGALQRGREAIYRGRSKKKAYKKQSPPKKKIIKPQRSPSDFFSKVKKCVLTLLFPQRQHIAH